MSAEDVETCRKVVNAKTEDESDEEFQDALDEKDDHVDETEFVTIENQISSALKLADLFFENEFEAAFAKCKHLTGKTLYHTISYAVFCWFRAWMTFEKPEIETALKAMKEAVEFSQKKRHPSSLVDILRTPDYEKYTEEEVHAELVYAESVFMLAMITFVQDQNFLSMISGAMRFRSGISSYRHCQALLKHRTNWDSKLSRDEYESGVAAGVGIYNLALSMSPPKVLKILEFIGLSGDRNRGIDSLKQAAFKSQTARGSYAAITLLCHFMYVETFIGWGNVDIKTIEELLNLLVERYPKSVFTLYFQAKYLQIVGRCTDAILTFEKAINIQDEWKQIHNGAYWEIMWTNGIQCNWKNAAKYADIMRKESKWSPCSFTYKYAAFLYMDEERRKENLENIENALREVPSLKRRLAGKSTPREKFAVAKADVYFKQNQKLLLPSLEFMYISNFFAVTAQSPPLVRSILDEIETAIRHHDKSQNKSFDDKALLLLLKGVCLRLLNFPLQAQECFVEILNNQNQLTYNEYIAPYSCMELGFTYITLNDLAKAKEWLKAAVGKYSKYVSEIVVHIRAHYALKYIREQKLLANAEIKK